MTQRASEVDVSAQTDPNDPFATLEGGIRFRALVDDAPLRHALEPLGCYLRRDGIDYRDERFRQPLQSLWNKFLRDEMGEPEFRRQVQLLGEKTSSGPSSTKAPSVSASADAKGQAAPTSVPAVSTAGAALRAASPPFPLIKEVVKYPPVVASPSVATVSVSPPGAAYPGPQRVRMACATSGVVIRYTLDGSEPTKASQAFREDVPIDRSCVVQARAFLQGVPGPVAIERFQFVAGGVSADPPAGAYSPPHTLRLTAAGPPATIRYTLDGSEPSSSSSVSARSGVTLDKTATLRARAFVDGWEPGPILTVDYVVEAPTWKDLEPSDRTDPVEHELCELLTPEPGWRLIGASVRGKLHAHRALWREDSFALGWQDSWQILVVGDGAGSSALSRVGSRLACSTTCEELKRFLKGFPLQVSAPEATAPDEGDLLRLKTFLMASVRTAQAALRREAAERKIPWDQLSSTLLAAVHTRWNERSLVACVQVGDGAVALWAEPGGLTLMGVADSGEFSGETRFLTTKGVEDDLDRRVLFAIKPNVRGIVAMTDGVADDYFPAQDRIPDLFAEMFSKVTNAERPEQALREWIKYEKKGSSDDRTLALLHCLGGE